MTINEKALQRALKDQQANGELIRRLASEPANGAELLEEIKTFISRFCAFPNSHALHAVTLWVMHAHMVENFHTTPRLALLSPEPASGKTRVLEVLDLLVPESMFCLNASPAALFRALSHRQITLLVDECDAIFTKRGRDDANEDTRALLNAGYKRGATIPRCVGPNHDVRHFEVFCATALAGLGELPETIMTRSIVIRMHRRGPNDQVEPFRTRKHEPEGHRIRDRVAIWATARGPAIGEAWPKMPEGIVDRPEEVWEPLVAVADAAGGDWPSRARAACVELCRAASDRKMSLGIRLLSDLRTIFGDEIALHTETILSRLHYGEAHGLEADAPWAELRGKPLGDRGLASMLRQYGVKPKKVKIAGKSLQGYRREDLSDVWSRYLPPMYCVTAEPTEPTEPGLQLLGQTAISSMDKGSGRLPRVPVSEEAAEPREPSQPSEVPQVPEVPSMRNSEPISAVGPSSTVEPEVTINGRSCTKQVEL